ncbi:MAG: hypothetical protein WDZ84_07555 [Rhodovibrionaceae bacterium]
MARITSLKLQRVNAATISAAGARYTPSLDEAAPNLEIQSLLHAIEALALSDSHCKNLASLAEDLEKAWKQSPQSIKKLFSRRRLTPKKLIALLTQLVKETPGTSERTLSLIKRTLSIIDERLSSYQQRLWEKQSEKEGDLNGKQKEQLESELYWLRKIISAVSDVAKWVRSPEFELVMTNRMFMRGEWGSGKTHFLCDFTEQRQQKGMPTLLLLAHHLPNEPNPLNAICRVTSLAPNPEELLNELDRLGKKADGRALIIIDGINEADRANWRKVIAPLARQVRRYAHVGLVLSCRTPFQQQLLDERSRKLYVHTRHIGFEEIEFDAQREFFRYYRIPNPHVPLLVSEFSRPLFLKIFCLSLSGKTKTTKSRGINAIASGQKGMTKIFEDFVVDIGNKIEADFNLPHKTCWNVLKGNFVDARNAKVGIAVTMANGPRDYVTRAECETILQVWTGWNDIKSIKKLLQRLITDGLLAEDVMWEDEAAQDIVRLPYQRFSDHLICRHLLETHLRSNTELEIRQSFFRNRPLGRIFEPDDWGGTYRMPGIASAIMLEFPERVKRVLPAAERELVFYLPKRVQLLMPLVDTFLEGLLWRTKDSFSRQTNHVVSTLLKVNDRDIQVQTLETLVCLASRQNHPYSAKRLVRYLKGFSLPDRDLNWSEFLRSAESSSAVYRLLDWLDIKNRVTLTGPTALNLARLCAMFLTTTNRPLRDRTTKALVLLGEVSPKALFKTVLQLLTFNDPYVQERMLAAAYGVVMRRWAVADHGFIREATELATALYDAMFAPRAPHATTHILTRDYALGVIHLAQKMDTQCLGRRSLDRITPPFPKSHAPIPPPRSIREGYCVAADSAIRMDFGNYTVGRLLASRRNYDSEHKEYRGVLRQIKWRILDLGYSEARFQQIDANVSSANFHHGRSENGHKIDRYGKKYSWIAFFEVSGMRADRDMLPHYNEDRRTSACDIDPSFPEPAPVWRPPHKPYFRRSTKDPVRWMRSGATPNYKPLIQMPKVDATAGPWVLLGGFILENAPEDGREVFTFLRGLLIAENYIARLRSRFMSIEYPGNQAIPDIPQHHYIYAGEIPWANNFAGDLRTRSGRVHRDMRNVFESYKVRFVRKRRGELNPEERKTFRQQQRQAELLQHLSMITHGDEGATSSPKSNTQDNVEFRWNEKIPGVPVELPVVSYAWESYHSTQNKAGAIDYPSPSICKRLDLRNTDDMVDLVDPRGKPATRYRVFNKDSDFSKSHLLYLRKDLLYAYLRQTRQRIVWLMWGERSIHYSQFEQMRPQLQPVLDKHAHIHRRMSIGRME